MNIKFEFVNLAQAIAAFSKNLTEPINRVVESEFVPNILNILKRNAPKRTGKMADSLFENAMGFGEWGISSGVNYEKWVRYGTLPHMIWPHKPPKALWWQSCTHPSAYARNPGIVPDDYVANSAAEFDLEARRTYEKIFGITVQELKF